MKLTLNRLLAHVIGRDRLILAASRAGTHSDLSDER